MTEHGPVATSEDGGPALSVIGQSSVANGVHATVDPPQAICLVGTENMTLREPESAKLAERNDAVLGLRQLNQRTMRTHFSPHTGDKCVRRQTLPPGNICSSV